MNSKIHPGQKLKDGDYFVFDKILGENQYKEISNICGFQFPSYVPYSLTGRMTVVTTSLSTLMSSHGICQTEHPFPDFKQLCENTFKD